MSATSGPPASPHGLPDPLAALPGGPHEACAQLRADAARNRSRLLEAAARLAAERGVGNLTMDEVAAAAKVGKGTLFRRFGDRTGLLIALLDHQEQQLQGAFLCGPPPLGPGAPAAERLHAFGPAVIRHEAQHTELYLAVRRDPDRRFANPAQRLRHSHLALLLREARTGGDDELLAHVLLAYLDTTLVSHLMTELRMPLERLEAGWHDLVDRCTAR